jgi:hypothetical protein
MIAREAGWSRWPTSCSPTRRSTRWPRPPPSSTPRRGFADTAGGARRRARHADPNAGPKTPRWSAAARMAVGRGPAASNGWSTARTERTPTWPSSATTSTTPSPWRACPRTARWRCSAAARRNAGRQAGARGPKEPAARAALRWPKAASRATWAGATRAARPTTCCASAWPGPGRSSSACPAWSATCSPACAKSAEAVAIKVFADNLRDLLLAAPGRPARGDGAGPGIRTGVKVAVVDATGKLLDTATVYPHEPRATGKARCTRWAGCGQARREPDRHRQRHRQPRDRQAGRRPDQAHQRSSRRT